MGLHRLSPHIRAHSAIGFLVTTRWGFRRAGKRADFWKLIQDANKAHAREEKERRKYVTTSSLACVSFGWLSNDFGPSGVIGDPTGSSADFGAEFFQQSVTRAVAALGEISRFSHAGPVQ